MKQDFAATTPFLASATGSSSCPVWGKQTAGPSAAPQLAQIRRALWFFRCVVLPLFRIYKEPTPPPDEHGELHRQRLATFPAQKSLKQLIEHQSRQLLCCCSHKAEGKARGRGSAVEWCRRPRSVGNLGPAGWTASPLLPAALSAQLWPYLGGAPSPQVSPICASCGEGGAVTSPAPHVGEHGVPPGSIVPQPGVHPRSPLPVTHGSVFQGESSSSPPPVLRSAEAAQPPPCRCTCVYTAKWVTS